MEIKKILGKKEKEKRAIEKKLTYSYQNPIWKIGICDMKYV